MTEKEDDEPSVWDDPAGMLDSIELEIRRVMPDHPDHDDMYGPDWHAEVLLGILMPALRKALRKAGTDIPAYGRWSADYEEMEAAARAAALEAEDARETALYRWWDEADVLLYVGIAGNLGGRVKGHVKGSSWMEFAARSVVERHPTRTAALAAETAAIKAEQPIFNFQHNNTPEARKRAVEYLIARDRLDLLAPAVSRG